MPLRASKMKGFILGFQRLVWCPKWTPASSNSLRPILITIFLLLEVRAAWRRRTIPRNTGLHLVLLWPPAPTQGRIRGRCLSDESRPKGWANYHTPPGTQTDFTLI